MPSCSASPARNAAIADDPVALGQAHDDDAAGARRVAVDRVGLGPDDLAAGADEEQLLVLLGDLLDGGDVAGLAALEADQADALAAAVLAPELGQRHALAVAGLGQDEQVAVGLDDAHRRRPSRPCGRAGCR